MKAIVQDRYGSADVLSFRDVDPPARTRGHVLVRVVAAGVDRGAWHLMTGQPYLMRLLGFGLRAPKTRVAGTNIAGVVEQVGDDVVALEPGDQVYGTCSGAYAQYAVASAGKLAPKPHSVTFEQAAVVPYAGFAALQAVSDHGRVQAGQQVLVVGASGAVGTVTVQIAAARGAHVTGVCSGASADLARSAGAERVLDYTRGDLRRDTQQHDVIIDIGGRTPVSQLRRLLTPRGTLVLVGGEGDRWIGGTHRQLGAALSSPFVSQRLVPFVVKENSQSLQELSVLIESGALRPVVERTYPLPDAADAVRQLDHAHQHGRIAITI